MPSKSKAQKRFMQIAAHDSGFAKRAGIAQSVAQEFVSADKRADRHAVKRVKDPHRGKNRFLVG